MRWLLLALVLLTACGAAATPTAEPPQALVTLLAFSGRPDPTWTLDTAQAAHVEAALAHAPPLDAAPPPDGLGYRGIEVTLATAQGPLRYRVYAGAIYASAVTGPLAHGDPGRALELWLLETGQSSLPPDLYAQLEATIQP